MNNKKVVMLIVLFIVSNYSLLFSQIGNDFEYPKSATSLSSPYLPHALNTNGEEGFSFVYNFPGFFSYYGQASIYYTNNYGDSFFGGVGELYLMGGIKKIFNIKRSSFYLNANIGTMFEERYLGSLGLSYLIYLNQNIRYEFVFDLFLNHGANGDMMIHDKTYSKGFVIGLNFGGSITDNLIIHFGIGFASIKYRYMRDKGEYAEYKYIVPI